MVRPVVRSLWLASLALLLALIIAACGNGDDSSPGDDSGRTSDATTGDGSAGKLDGSKDSGRDATVDQGSDASTCGHASGVTCAAGKACTAADDCASGVCTKDVCKAPTATDGVMNGGETGVDCGGATIAGSDDAPPCANGLACGTGTDCQSAVCQQDKCVLGSCTDGVKNGDETDKDCGGSCGACADGKACLEGADCIDLDCKSSVCQAASCSDTIKNGLETATDCGGGVCPTCASGLACGKATDCQSDVCTLDVCQVPTDTDKAMNGGETDVDCGGATTAGSDGAPACAAGKKCLVKADCTSDVCTGDVCQAATDEDMVQNGDETDTDCGGAATPGSDGAPACAPGKMCLVASDCSSDICTSKKCTTPTSSDGVKNGGETAIDCGGAATAGSDGAPACNDSKTCLVDSDCLSTACGTTTKVCVTGVSCKPTNGKDAAGIDTCGVGETGVKGSVHESCCTSLPLPSSTSVRLDKYEVTAGRMRQFITAVGPNIHDWVTAQIAAGTTAGNTMSTQIPSVVRPFLPTTDDTSQPLNLLLQLGAGLGVMNTDQPSAEQGCYVADGAYGAAEYRLDDDVLIANGLPARTYTQAQLDEKPMNCAPYWLMAAFCAWDGGALPTPAQQAEAWGTSQYPWGPNMVPDPYPTNTPVQDFTTTVNYFNNTELFYHFPDYSGSQNHDDNSGYISAPGRFVLDVTAASSANGDHWYDLGADMMEFAATVDSDGVGAPFCDYSGLAGTTTASCDYTTTDSNNVKTVHHGLLRSSGLPTSEWMGGSWEGHEQFSQTNQPFFQKHFYTEGLDVQYGKTDARCVRPAE